MCVIVCELTLTSVEATNSAWHRVAVDHAVLFGRRSVLWMLLVIHGRLKYTPQEQIVLIGDMKCL